MPGDTVQFTCTYDPTLAQELPALRKAPPHFVTWGDGSSDEMCLGLIQTVPLDPHATVDWAAIGSGRPFGGQGFHAGAPATPGPARRPRRRRHLTGGHPPGRRQDGAPSVRSGRRSVTTSSRPAGPAPAGDPQEGDAH